MIQIALVDLSLRFAENRKTQVENAVLFPGNKRKHPKEDFKDLIRRSEEDYVDFRQAG